MKQSVILACCLIAAYAPAFAQQEKQPPPPPPPPKIEVVKFRPPVIIKDTDLADFYKRNPAVAEITWESEKDIEIHFKDKEKKTEAYDLSDETEGNAFKAKYGDPPAPLAPPPPPPPKKKKREVI
jgi:hypothetical protein